MVEPLSPAVKLGDAACVCLGSGRFLASQISQSQSINTHSAKPIVTQVNHALDSPFHGPKQRAVLVPAVEQAGLRSIIFQTRGDSFPTMMYGER